MQCPNPMQDTVTVKRWPIYIYIIFKKDIQMMSSVRAYSESLHVSVNYRRNTKWRASLPLIR